MQRTIRSFGGGILFAGLMAGLVALSGCEPGGGGPESGSSASTPAASAPKPKGEATAPKPDSAATSKNPKEKEVDQPAEPRTTTAGWWRVLFSAPIPRDENATHDLSAGFVKIIPKGDGFLIAELRSNEIFGEAEISEDSTATKKSVTLLFEHPQISFNYQGTLKDGVIRGNLQFKESTRQNLVRLVPVAESEVTDESQSEIELGRTDGAGEILAAASDEEPIAALQAGKAQWSGNPAYVLAWRSLVRQVGELDLDDGQVKELVAGYVSASKPWGERAVQLAKIQSAMALLSEARNTEYAKSLLAEAKAAAPALRELWTEQIKAAKELAAVETAWNEVQSGDAQVGLEKLRQLQKKNPAGELVTYRLALAERKTGSKEQAGRLFATLAVAPRSFSVLPVIAAEEDLVEPRTAAAELYDQREGSHEGFEDYLASIYAETVTNFLSDEQKSRPATESQRVALVELFTGASCPPCVAADVGTEAITESFPQEDVILLRYHVHIPAADPLATSATEARMDYYASDIVGTPTILVDGTKVPFPTGGGYRRAEAVYQSLAEVLSAEVATPTSAKLTASTSVEGTDLHIHVEGATSGKPFDTVKLRIVIAENAIHFSARNGILEHSMVVRSMPAGPEGIASEKGSYTFDETISLVELRESISDYLDAEETRRGITFRDRPADFGRLAVVAFLQDDVTHEVLQAVKVPIEQDIVLPPVSADEKSTKDDGNEGGPALKAP